jgi:hypothetical protein
MQLQHQRAGVRIDCHREVTDGVGLSGSELTAFDSVVDGECPNGRSAHRTLGCRTADDSSRGRGAAATVATATATSAGNKGRGRQCTEGRSHQQPYVSSNSRGHRISPVSCGVVAVVPIDAADSLNLYKQ